MHLCQAMHKFKIDQIIHSERKTIALIITNEGKLIVRAPLRYPKAKIDDLVDQKTGWIEKKLTQVQKFNNSKEQKAIKKNDQFWFLGKQYDLYVSEGNSSSITLRDKFYLSRKVLPQVEKVFTHWYRLQARKILEERAGFLSKRFGFSYKTIKITSARTRWGSCSTRGTLSFPWRLVMAPLPVIDYVVIHELVHTVERNHQKGFWNKVAMIEPHYKEHIRWLKENGYKLQISQ